MAAPIVCSIAQIVSLHGDAAAQASGSLTRAFVNSNGNDSNACTQQSAGRNIGAGLAAHANDGEIDNEDTGTLRATAAGHWWRRVSGSRPERRW